MVLGRLLPVLVGEVLLEVPDQVFTVHVRAAEVNGGRPRREVVVLACHRALDLHTAWGPQRATTALMQTLQRLRHRRLVGVGGVAPTALRRGGHVEVLPGDADARPLPLIRLHVEPLGELVIEADTLGVVLVL